MNHSTTCKLQCSKIQRYLLGTFVFAEVEHLGLITQHSEAKRLQQGLKELLKTHEPWDRDVDIQRKKYVASQDPGFKRLTQPFGQLAATISTLALRSPICYRIKRCSDAFVDADFLWSYFNVQATHQHTRPYHPWFSASATAATAAAVAFTWWQCGRISQTLAAFSTIPF